MSLDTRTLILVHILMSIFCLIVGWSTYKGGQALGIKGPKMWLLGFSATTIGLIALVLRGLVPDLLSVGLGNFGTYLGISLHILGIWQFTGQKPLVLAAIITPILATLAHVFLFVFFPPMFFRVQLFASYYICACSAAVFALIWLAPKKIRRITRSQAVFFVLIILLYVYRVIISLVLPESDWLEGGTLESIYLLGSMLVFAGMAFAELQLVHRILVAERQAVAESKSLLLKEMSHRTKNNFQMAEALFALEAERFSDEKVKISLSNLQARLHSIGLLHLHLSTLESEDQLVRLDDYLMKILETLVPGTGAVRLFATLEPITLHVDKALSIGLILNELVSNSLKYAFCGTNYGSISVKLCVFEGKLELLVFDSGQGYGENKKEGMGSLLIKNLLAQLNATSKENGKGFASTTIYVPL